MKAAIPVSEHLRKLPSAVRPIVQAARRTVGALAPEAVEVSYQSEPPRSKSFMWKIVRYTVDGKNVLGIGTFSTYSTVFFYRGRELDDGSGMLTGSGKDSRFITLRSAADAERPAVKQLVRKAFRLGGAAKARS
ncbi:MAG: DUF1801 domain-containing protein [Candidatus Dormibacter sp.]